MWLLPLSDDRVSVILAEHGIDKVRALDKDRRHLAELAAQKRSDKEATRPDVGRGDAPSQTETIKDAKTRAKAFIERVAARLRKSKERDDRHALKTMSTTN
jgi:hypothetical protein